MVFKSLYKDFVIKLTNYHTSCYRHNEISCKHTSSHLFFDALHLWDTPMHLILSNCMEPDLSHLATFKTPLWLSLFPSHSISILSAPTSSQLIPQPYLLSPSSHNHITSTTARHQFHHRNTKSLIYWQTQWGILSIHLQFRTYIYNLIRLWTTKNVQLQI